jgi:hypothetical protein
MVVGWDTMITISKTYTFPWCYMHYNHTTKNNNQGSLHPIQAMRGIHTGTYTVLQAY